jgi:amidophosphoribosyltransferase
MFMCGVVGLIGEDNVGEKLYPALFALQHRGQDAAGILSYDFSKAEFQLEKELGLVEDVFSPEKLKKLKGQMAIGHTRYSTVGRVKKEDLQPMVVGYPYGIGLAHNGNVTNYSEVLQELKSKKFRWNLSHNDLEVLLNVMASNFVEGKGSIWEHLQDSVKEVFLKVQGAFSAVGMLADHGLFAFCDPNGIRPLLLGKKKLGNGKFAYAVASEKQVFRVLGYDFERDLSSGELIFIDKDLVFHSNSVNRAGTRPCMFEWVYFSGAENQWHGRPVYDVRLKLGEYLAQSCREQLGSVLDEIDLVAPVPETARVSAVRMAEVLGKPYREVLNKNRYVQRSFIVNESEAREALVRLKLLPVESEIRGKNILLVDDSVVRGTTSARIVQLLRNSGAKKVILASTCPEIRHPCFYGIDFPDKKALIAFNRTREQIRNVLEVDDIVFCKLPDLKKAIGIETMCAACLDGDYPVKVDVSEFLSQREVTE